jgi:hypothetical protein
MISEFKKLNRDVLLEWIYDSNNSILETYNVLSNSRDLITSYIASESSITNNNKNNQLFRIDAAANKYSKIDTTKYTFLTLKEYVSPIGIQHDTIKIYFPSNWNFGEYQGIYLKLYTYDFRNRKFFEISNFFFDFNDTQTLNLLTTFAQPLLYEDRNWNKYLQLSVPSVNFLSKQRLDGRPEIGSVNEILTGGLGLSQTSPIFIDFQFITRITQIGQIKNYLTNQRYTTQVPQIPELQELRLFMQESNNGDYFEIYATYNNSFQDFIEFVNNSKSIGKFYYLEFEITVYEENIKGKTLKYKIDSDFSEIVEYRPIIKYSTTKSILSVEMRFINKVDGSATIRKAAYGMKPDQLSKYLIKTKKINVRNVFKPKIYSKNQFSKYRTDELGKRDQPENIVEVPVPNLIPIVDNSRYISAYCKQALNRFSTVKLENYLEIGAMKIGIKPFDNIFKFIFAFKNGDSLEPLDLTNCQNLKLIIKSDNTLLEFSQYFTSETVARLGMCQFKISEEDFQKVKNMYKTGINIFYITTLNQGIQNVIYSGLYQILDKLEDLDFTNINGAGEPEIILDKDSKGVAIVTRFLRTNQAILPNRFRNSVVQGRNRQNLTS